MCGLNLAIAELGGPVNTVCLPSQTDIRPLRKWRGKTSSMSNSSSGVAATRPKPQSEQCGFGKFGADGTESGGEK